MTRTEHDIRRRILDKLRWRIARERCATIKTYLLGLEAGELMKGNCEADRQALQRNYREAQGQGVKIPFDNPPAYENR